MLRVGWGMKGTKTRLELGGTARAGLGGLEDPEGALDVHRNLLCFEPLVPYGIKSM